MSVALIEPFALTSERKFAALTGCPDCDLVWPMSVAFTGDGKVVAYGEFGCGKVAICD
jgi:hypothetical protein